MAAAGTRAIASAALASPAAGTAAFWSASSIAYQGYGRGLPLDEIRAANAVATAGRRPDLTVAQNIYLGRELPKGLTVDDRAMNEGAARALADQESNFARTVAGSRCASGV